MQVYKRLHNNTMVWGMCVDANWHQLLVSGICPAKAKKQTSDIRSLFDVPEKEKKMYTCEWITHAMPSFMLHRWLNTALRNASFISLALWKFTNLCRAKRENDRSSKTRSVFVTNQFWLREAVFVMVWAAYAPFNEALPFSRSPICLWSARWLPTSTLSPKHRTCFVDVRTIWRQTETPFEMIIRTGTKCKWKNAIQWDIWASFVTNVALFFSSPPHSTTPPTPPHCFGHLHLYSLTGNLHKLRFLRLFSWTKHHRTNTTWPPSCPGVHSEHV